MPNEVPGSQDMFAPAPGPVRPDPEFEAIEEEFRRNAQRRQRGIILLCITVTLLAFGIAHGDRLMRNGRRAWFRWQAWTSDAPLAGVDLERVHGALLTQWVVARNEDDEAADRAFQAMKEAILPSPALTNLFTTLHELATPDRGLLKRNEDLQDVVATWNELLKNGGAPWWLEGNMLVGQGSAQFYVKTYRIRGTAVLTVGEERVVTRLLSRADHLNVVELALGHASPDKDHAALLLHRIRDHARDVLWPALSATETVAQQAAAPGEDTTLAGRVRSEVRVALTDAEWQALSSTAAARRTLVRIRRSVTASRRCGARLVLHIKKLEGLDLDTLRWLRGLAVRESQYKCAAITPAQVVELANASRVLRRTGGMVQALDRLVIWLARNVAVHESRHVADQRVHRGLEKKLPCRQCPDSFSVRSSAELSAWLAEVAWGPSPFTTLHHACSLPSGTSTGRALRFLLGRLGSAVCSRPPVDVQRRARLLELKIFGREERVRFVSPLPDRMTSLKRR
ncbi:MAG: hypothetical protein KC502_15110 [Myxococcales bacterium]|nr:hypothetical protein [Myxococcales bacterium]